MSTVILANGRFPTHPVPLSILKNATRLICCDGAANNMEAMGLTPTAIVGDLDSLSEDLKGKYSDRLFQDTDTETNDLTKAVKWCRVISYSAYWQAPACAGMPDSIGLLPHTPYGYGRNNGNRPRNSGAHDYWWQIIWLPGTGSIGFFVR